MQATDEVATTQSAPLWCSIRVLVALIGFLGMVVHFSQKSNITIGLVCMVNHSAIERYQVHFTGNRTLADDDCSQNKEQDQPDGPFAWSKNKQGLILGSYFWGYLITQIPAGYLAGRFGARYIYGGAIFLSSFTTLFLPMSADAHWMVFAVLQVIVGLAHGAIWPCLSVIGAHWAPVNERGKIMSMMNTGAQVGNVLILSTGGFMCSWNFAGGWPLIFYSTGCIGLLWSVAWIWFYRNSPKDHRYISAQEREFILRHTSQQLSGGTKRDFHIPWRAILTSRVCWALFTVHTCFSYGAYTFLTSIPKYMSEVLKFDIKSNGVFSALPYIAVWFSSLLSGFAADRLIRRKLLTITQTRKLFTSTGVLLVAVLVLGLVFVTCQLKYLAVALLTIGTTLNGLSLGGGFFLVANDIAPAYAGIVFGVSNTFATISGIVSPYVVGAVTERDPTNWRPVFFICSIIYVIGAIVFFWFGSSEVQPWAVRRDNQNEVDVNLLTQKTNELPSKTVSRNEEVTVHHGT